MEMHTGARLKSGTERIFVRKTRSPRRTSTSAFQESATPAKPACPLSVSIASEADTLLSFERPLLAAVYAHLENSIAATHVFFSIKRTRAHGGCLGAESR